MDARPVDPRVVIALASWIALLFLAEQVAGLRRRTRPLPRRLLINFVFSVLVLGAAAALVRPAESAALQWAAVAPLGVIQLVPMPVALQFVVAFLLMDLTFYWWHVANHRIPFLWRFHNVHHIDPDLDVSTAFRFHVGEVALSAGFRVAQVAAIGPAAWMFFAYELVFQASTFFHHSNIRLPIRIERLLNVVLVTPRMHGIHHSQVAGETNSNYSVVFSWWDRLHRTLGLNVSQSAIAIGVPGYTRPEDNDLWRVLVLPFARQRDYWRRPDGTIVRRNGEALTGRPSHLAE